MIPQALHFQLQVTKTAAALVLVNTDQMLVKRRARILSGDQTRAIGNSFDHVTGVATPSRGRRAPHVRVIKANLKFGSGLLKASTSHSTTSTAIWCCGHSTDSSNTAQSVLRLVETTGADKLGFGRNPVRASISWKIFISTESHPCT